MAKIALGTWAWGAGAFGGDAVFGSKTDVENLKPVLSQLEALTNEMTTIGQKYGASCSQIGIAWAIAKGTQPIVGATPEHHVIEAAEAAKIQLTSEEVARLEALADATGIDTRGGWEHSME